MLSVTTFCLMLENTFRLIQVERSAHLMKGRISFFPFPLPRFHVKFKNPNGVLDCSFTADHAFHVRRILL
jgi:hypothetical protein